MKIVVKCSQPTCPWEKLAHSAALASKYAREHATKHKDK